MLQTESDLYRFLAAIRKKLISEERKAVLQTVEYVMANLDSLVRDYDPKYDVDIKVGELNHLATWLSNDANMCPDDKLKLSYHIITRITTVLNAG